MEIVGFIAGTLTLIGYLPQAIKTMRTRRTKDVSLLAFTLIFASALLWMIYGIARKAPEIYLANGVVVICTAVIVGIKLRNILIGKEKSHGANR